MELCQQRSLWDFVNVEKSSTKMFNKQDSIAEDISPSILGQKEPSLGYFLGKVEVDISSLRMYFFDYFKPLLG